MLCVSLGETTSEEIQKVAKIAPFVEVRLDLNSFSKDQIENIFRLSNNLIATFRAGENHSIPVKILSSAVNSGACYIDVEYDTDPDDLKEIVRIAKKEKCKMIISYHNYLETPSLDFLRELKGNIFKSGADISKTACMVNSKKDIISILSLYEGQEDTIAIGMGIEGVVTRVSGYFLDSPLTYTSFNGKATADGQIDFFKMKKIIEILKESGKDFIV